MRNISKRYSCKHEDLTSKIEHMIWDREGHKKGKEIFFLCPNHDDHHPSARWNPEKKVWFCDVCGIGGGWFNLAEKLGLIERGGYVYRK